MTIHVTPIPVTSIPHAKTTGQTANDHTTHNFAAIATGNYTGDGSTDLAITGVGFQPNYLAITRRFTTTTNFGDREFCWTTSAIIDDDPPSGINMTADAGTLVKTQTDMILSLDADGFSVTDHGAGNESPNTSGVVYNYLCIGTDAP